MIRLLILFPAWIISAQAAEMSASGVLSRVSKTYSHIQSLDIRARREITFGGGSAVSELDLAVQGHSYAVRYVESGDEARAISDGETTWKVLSRGKRWMQVSAATGPSEEEEDSSKGKDFRSFVSSTLGGRYPALVKLAADPAIVREEDFRLGKEKVPAVVVKFDTPKGTHELTIDQQRYVVLLHRWKTEVQGRPVLEVVKTLAVRVNEPIDESRFHFEPPGNGWNEVESLAMPFEQNTMLTGTHLGSIRLASLDGGTVTIDAKPGKVLVLDFWATW